MLNPVFIKLLYQQKIIKRINDQIKLKGVIEVLRKGITDGFTDTKIRLFFDKPVSAYNTKNTALYQANIFSAIRQVYYSTKNRNSLDIVTFINGLPVVSFELKNELTKQNVKHAIKQYKTDRDPNEELFRLGRMVVNFAVDTEEVWMCTELKGDSSYFLPFNKGNKNGAGNEPNGGIKTDYLWKEILTRDTFTNIFQNYAKLITEEKEYKDSKGKKKIKKTKKLIFPRFHQLNAVSKILEDAKEKGAGQKYLIQHSAGSGKSNSISWLAHQLVGLHDKTGASTIFDTVIVITDRRVLDKQIRENIKQYQQVKGVVAAITEGSKQLKFALEDGKKIIITTIQKFPHIVEEIGDLPGNNFGIIIDEAHSSLSGQMARKLNETLAKVSDEEKLQNDLENYDETEDDEVTGEDFIRAIVKARKLLPNASYFAFTATPKNKTLELFGEPFEQDGKTKYKAFHLYSMKQAIEEGFILDVLKNYTTYNTYFKLSKEIEEDPNVNKKQAARAIGRFLSMHPHNLAQKTEVMVEHFRQVVSKKIGGKAKAMVVTGSRLHAVRYKEEFDKYIKEKGYNDIKTLVAFSGKVIYDTYPEGVTEVELNGFKEKELPKKFGSSEYQLLLVADKYQTGFDQPLLHTMYVDKKLSGVKCVQTLSRLNRMCAGKEDTFILDFANDTEDILESFQPYYELTTVETTTDPNHLYDLKAELEKAQILWQSEVDNFCNVFFKSIKALSVKEQGKLNAFVDPAVERFKQLPEESTQGDIINEISQEDFKHALQSFTRLYSFLTQIMPFSDVELEKLFTYSRFLLKKLPRKNQADRFKLGDEVSLEYYRLQKIAEQDIALEDQEEYGLDGGNESGIRISKEEQAALSEIINVLNKKFGTEFSDADKLFFDQIEAELVADVNLNEQAKSNSMANFKFGFEDVFMDKLIGRMEQNQDIFTKMMDDKDFGGLVKDYMLKKVYERLNNPSDRAK